MKEENTTAATAPVPTGPVSDSADAAKEKKKAAAKKYREEHKEEYREYHRKWYQEHKAKGRKRLETAGQDDNTNDETPEEPAAPEMWFEVAMILDGKRYVLESGNEGCEGCVFNASVGNRQLCSAISDEETTKANNICRELDGQWHEVSQTEEE